MGVRPFAFTVEKSMPATQAVPNSPTVVPFNKHVRLLAKFESITSTGSSRAVPPPSAGTEGSPSGWYGPKCVIIDFAHADRGLHAAKGHDYRSSENETPLTVTDYAAIAYVVMAVGFYPALAWLFSS
jgi:hypothetical protein